MFSASLKGSASCQSFHEYQAINQRKIRWKRVLLPLSLITLTSAFRLPVAIYTRHPWCIHSSNNMKTCRHVSRVPKLVSCMSSLPFHSTTPTRATSNNLVNRNYLFFHQRMNVKFRRRYSCSSKSSHLNATEGKDKCDSGSDEVFMDRFLATINSTLHDEIVPKVLDSWKRSPESSFIILLCVSGGCDSVALFHSMVHLMKKSSNVFPKGYQLSLEDGINVPCELHVVHFDHQQRGEESDKDRLLVEKMCRDNNIQFHCFYWNNGKSNTKGGRFSQEVARDWRKSKSIELLSEIMRSTQNRGLILTAHHKDDSVETVLLKMLRGVHITNISGLKSVQQDLIDDRIFIGKPMLKVGKKDIERFLMSQSIPWREDSSNQSSKYLRNRVRNDLIPLLNELVGGETILYSRLINAQEQSRKLREDVTQRAESYLQSCNILCDSNISYYPVPQHGGPLSAVEEEALHKWVDMASQRKISLSYDKVSMICRQLSEHPDRGQWKISIGNEWEVVRDGDVLKLLNEPEFGRDQSLQTSESSWTFRVVDTLHGYNQDSISTQFVSLAMNPAWNGKIPVFSLQKVEGNESLKFIPYWRKGTSEIKVKEFLRGQKVPLHRRVEAPILCVEGNHSLLIVAVFVEGEGNSFDQCGRWVVHADFHVESDSVDERITIALKKA